MLYYNHITNKLNSQHKQRNIYLFFVAARFIAEAFCDIINSLISSNEHQL